MVCKELDELCAKFGSLSPHLRIDYIYGMLRMCLPPELRFIGSVVEDLAKKDFNHLREHENKANNQTELKKYRNVDEKTLIEGMAFNLSLLHSVNTPCANIIFSLLEENSKSAFHISNSTDKKTIDIILLVLTMAKYHPAFTFHQRTVFTEYYKKVEQQLHNIYAKVHKSHNDFNMLVTIVILLVSLQAIALSPLFSCDSNGLHLYTSPALYKVLHIKTSTFVI